MDKTPGIIVEKSGQEKIDFDFAFLCKTIEEINSDNNFFKLNPGDVQYDGVNFIVDQKKMTLDELKKYVKNLNNIKKDEFLEEIRQQTEQAEEERNFRRRNPYN